MAGANISFSPVTEVPGGILARFSGQLDESNVEDLAKEVYEQIENKPLTALLIDLSDLSYMNSRSIGYLADWQGKLSSQGSKMVIFGAKEEIFDILDVVGLSQLIPITDTIESALKAL